MSETAQRPCPKCGPTTLLKRQAVRGPTAQGSVDIDVCGYCRGVWLDWGEIGELHELQAIIPGAQSNISWKRDLKHGSCAHCAARPALARIPVGSFGVDRCPDCLGLWFDGGELGPMLTDQGFEALLRALRAHPPD